MSIHFGYISDLHLDFYNIEDIPYSIFYNKNNDIDILLIPGDIAEYKNYYKLDKFFHTINNNFPQTYIVAGNHEFYNTELSDYTYDSIDQFLSKFENIKFLQNQSINITNNIKLVAATLWTNLNRQNPVTEYHITSILNDFRYISNNKGYPLTTQDWYQQFEKSYIYIQNVINNSPKDINHIILTHHAPSLQSIHPKYQYQGDINYGFASRLEDYILNHDNIKYWIHGHIHHATQYNIDKTIVGVNALGYPDEKITQHNAKSIKVFSL